MAYYSYFSLIIQAPSRLKLPYIPEVFSPDTYDVSITFSTYCHAQKQEERKQYPMQLIESATVPTLIIQKIHTRFTIEVEGVALINIVDKESIEIMPYTQDNQALSQAVWGNGFCAYAALHHYLVLHANTIVYNEKAYLLLGESGAGKSTLTSYLHQKGYGVLSDDISCLKVVDNTVWAFSGKREVRLFDDSTKAMGYQKASSSRQVLKNGAYKWCFTLSETTPHLQYPVAGMVYLNKGADDCLFSLLKGHEKFNAVLSSVMMFSRPEYAQNAQDQFNLISGIVQRIVCWRFDRGLGFDGLSFFDEHFKLADKNVSKKQKPNTITH